MTTINIGNGNNMGLFLPNITDYFINIVTGIGDFVPFYKSGHLLVLGDDVDDRGVTLSPSGSLQVVFDAIGFGHSNTKLDFLDVTGDAVVNINSDHISSTAGGANSLGQLIDTDNSLTTVTISGSYQFDLGVHLDGNANFDDGVVTDTAAAVPVATTIDSSLHLIDASATTGGVNIYAGATNTGNSGIFDNGNALSNNLTVVYDGLEIKGGSGKDIIENDANNGIVTVGNHANDVVILGGSNENATLGTGADDQVQVGVSHLGTTESPGQAINDTITFANGASAELVIGAGAEAGSTAGTENVGQTNVVGAASGMTVDLIIATSFLPIIDATATVSQAKTIETAENLAVASLGGQGGVAYFNFGNDEYIVDAPPAGGSGGGFSDSIVHLVGIQDLAPHAVGPGGGSGGGFPEKFVFISF